MAVRCADLETKYAKANGGYTTLYHYEINWGGDPRRMRQLPQTYLQKMVHTAK